MGGGCIPLGDPPFGPNNGGATLDQVGISYNTGVVVSAIEVAGAVGQTVLDNSLVETDGGTSHTVRVRLGGVLNATNTTFSGNGLRVEYLGSPGILNCNVFGDPGSGGPSLFTTGLVQGTDNAGFGVSAIVPPLGGANLNNPVPLFAPAAPDRFRLDPVSPAAGYCNNVLPVDLVGVSRLDDPGAFELP